MKVFIGIGSNMGDPLNNCLKAIGMIGQAKSCHVMRRSSFYRTEPVGYKNQDWFVNCVILVETELAPHMLLTRLQEIEYAMGRKREIKWGPRCIDLDIILYGDLIIRDEKLIIPHPFMHKRRFVLIPMNEIASNVIHPVLNKTVKELLNELPDDGQAVFPIRDDI